MNTSSSTPSGEPGAVRTPEAWQRANEAYLSTALRWLRLRLRERIPAAESPPAPAPPSSRTKRRWPFGGDKSERETLALPPGPPAGPELDEAAAAMAGAEAADPPSALLALAHQLGLSRFERDVMLLCAALDLDAGIAPLCAAVQDDPDRAYPTFALALTLFDDPAWEALSPERPLRFWRLIEVERANGESLTTAPLRADERIVNYLKGLNHLDARLAPYLAPFDVAPLQRLPPSQEVASAHVAHRIRRAADGQTAPTVQLVGSDPISKQLVAQHAAHALGLAPYRLPTEALPARASELETLARLWHRESVLLPLALYLDAHEHDMPAHGEAGTPTTSATMSPLHRFLARGQGVFLLSTSDVRSGTERAAEAVEVGKPTPVEQRIAWNEALGEHAGESPDLLAGQFDMDTLAIRRVASVALAEDAEGRNGRDLHDRLWQGCLGVTAPRMDSLAQRLQPLATWNDIVLPDEELTLLRRLATQVAHRARVYDDWGFRERMNRGLGISALFTGESGTGKTMAAEVIANELKLHLYRIDLSAVVSKYIGETEKNLRRLFDAAEGGGAILFFDEADALFGKRSEVRDSHDRYANIEINYLLQRMEAYRGLAILATNMRSALDEAFMRRLRFVVTFPFPGATQREAIWRSAWPADTPTEGLDHARLARLGLTGGAIANVALNATFMAADRGGPVTMPLVLAAARAEYRKLGRPIRDADFRWEGPRSARPPAVPTPRAETSGAEVGA
jgi:hypothetical protein